MYFLVPQNILFLNCPLTKVAMDKSRELKSSNEYKLIWYYKEISRDWQHCDLYSHLCFIIILNVVESNQLACCITGTKFCALKIWIIHESQKSGYRFYIQYMAARLITWPIIVLNLYLHPAWASSQVSELGEFKLLPHFVCGLTRHYTNKKNLQYTHVEGWYDKNYFCLGVKSSRGL